MNWVRHVGSTTWFQTTRYCCAKVEFNSSNWVRHGSSTTFETGRTLGLIQTLSRSCSLRPDFGRNADWLLEQFYKIWLAVGNAESWKRLDPPSAERKVDFAVFFIVLWSYGRKYALTCTMEIQKIHMVVHIFSGFALFTELMWVYRGVESLCKLVTANKVLFHYQQTSAEQNTIHLKSGFIWKFSREWLFWTGYASGGSLRKKPQSPTVKYKTKNIASLFKEFL